MFDKSERQKCFCEKKFCERDGLVVEVLCYVSKNIYEMRKTIHSTCGSFKNVMKPEMSLFG